jgi:CheY-like chemotaxis protein
MTDKFDILILDDHRDSADLLAYVLTDYFPKASVRVVYSGEAAVAAATDRSPDVAIFDLEMPGLGGEAAARLIRGSVRANPGSLVAISGNVMRLESLRSEGPFDHLMTKPIDMHKMVSLLTTLSL